MSSKQRAGFLIGFLIIIIAIIYSCAIIYFKKLASDRYEEFDLATTTSSDYTVETKISEDAYNYFLIEDKKR